MIFLLTKKARFKTGIISKKIIKKNYFVIRTILNSVLRFWACCSSEHGDGFGPSQAQLLTSLDSP